MVYLHTSFQFDSLIDFKYDLIPKVSVPDLIKCVPELSLKPLTKQVEVK